jgi:hypothetical protein
MDKMGIWSLREYGLQEMLSANRSESWNSLLKREFVKKRGYTEHEIMFAQRISPREEKGEKESMKKGGDPYFHLLPFLPSGKLSVDSVVKKVNNRGKHFLLIQGM